MYSLARKCAFNSATCKYVSKAFAHMSKQEIMWNWPAQKFDQHFLAYLNKPDIDGWELRKALTELANFDVVPDPKLVEAALRACRRVNDLSLAVRFLEQIKYKSGGPVARATVYPYIIQEKRNLFGLGVIENHASEVRPVLDELGIRTPEELGYDQPEFFTPEPEWYWEKSWYKLYGYTKMPGFKHFA